MNLFSISQLEQFSGIKAHRIRIWEQRYNALQPSRSQGNTRYYSDKQLKRFLNIVSLLNTGMKVSQVCKKSDNEIAALVEKFNHSDEEQKGQNEFYISQLIAAGIEFDEVQFEKVFSHCILCFGIIETYTQIVYPMLERIGILWAVKDLPASSEHFISNLLKQKFYAAIDALPPPKNVDERWILLLPEDEFHEIGLLISNYLIRKAGKQVIYLGSNVPLESLSNAARQCNATHLFLFFTRCNHVDNVNQYLKELSQIFRKTKIHIAGSNSLISKFSKTKSVSSIKSVQELQVLLNNYV